MTSDVYAAAEIASLHAQYTKHKEKDKIDFPPFPKAGAHALDWFDLSIDKIVDAGPNTAAVVKWAGDMRRLTLEQLHDPGHHATLCHKMRMELMTLIPKTCQLHYDVRLADRQLAARDQRLSGRQVWRMIYEYFQENQADRAVADMKRLERCTVQEQQLERFLNDWNTLVCRLVKLPSEEYLFMRFRDQVSRLQHSEPRHYFHDYYFAWDNLPEGDPQKNYQGLYSLVVKAVEKVQATDLRNESLKADTQGRAPLAWNKADGKGKGDAKGKGKSKTKGGKDKGKGKSKTKGPPKKESPGGKDSKGKAKGEKTQGKTACYDRKKVCLDYLKK